MPKHLKCECGSTEFQRELERKDIHEADITFDKKLKAWRVSPGELIDNIEPDDARCELICKGCGEVYTGPEDVTFD